MPPETRRLSVDYDTHTKTGATSGSYQVTLNAEAQQTLQDLLAEASPASYDQLLLQNYHDCHASIDTLHARIDTLSQYYLLAIGAVLSVFIGATGDLPQLILLIIPVIALAAWRQILGTRAVYIRLCHTQAQIEKRFNTDKVKPEPATNALTYATDGLVTRDTDITDQLKWTNFKWYDRRVLAWFWIAVVTGLIAAVFVIMTALCHSGAISDMCPFDLNAWLFESHPPLSEVLAPFELTPDATVTPTTFTIQGAADAGVTCTVHAMPWRITCDR